MQDHASDKNLVATLTKTRDWARSLGIGLGWAGRDSNPWPPDYQSGALAKLSYQPTVVGRPKIGYNSFPNGKRIRSDHGLACLVGR